MLSLDDSRAAAERLVDRAMKAGADAADVLYAGGRSTSVQVRLGELEHVERSEDEEIGLRVFIGSKSATVASSDLSNDALEELVTRALAMAGEAPEDPFAGLGPSELLARPPFPALESVDPIDLDPAELRERALEAEAAALAVAGVKNSSGASGNGKRRAAAKSRAR